MKQYPFVKLATRKVVRTSLLVALSFMVAALISTQLAGHASAPAAPASTETTQETAAGAAALDLSAVLPATRTVKAELAAAAQAGAWPDMSPSMDDVIAGPQAAEDIGSCGKGPVPNEVACTFGDANAQKTVFLVGDSVAMTYAGALKSALTGMPGWNLKVYSMFGCSFTSELVAAEAVKSTCPGRKKAAIEALNSQRPDLVLISHTYEPRTVNGQARPMTPEVWATGMAGILQEFRASVGRVAFLSPPPSDANIAECFSKASAPATCASKVTSQWANMFTAEQSLGLEVIDSRDWFCTPSGVCPAFAGGVPTKMDKVHMTPAYAVKIAPAILERFNLLAYFD